MEVFSSITNMITSVFTRKDSNEEYKYKKYALNEDGEFKTEDDESNELIDTDEVIKDEPKKVESD